MKYATFEIPLQYLREKRIHWLDQRIVRKQLDIMLTYYYLENQGKLMMQSRENEQKLQSGQFSTISRANISKLQIFLKNKFHSNWRSYSTDFRPKTSKVVRAVFEKIIKVSDFGLIWRPFHDYLQVTNFFQKFGSVTFLPL